MNTIIVILYDQNDPEDWRGFKACDRNQVPSNYSWAWESLRLTESLSFAPSPYGNGIVVYVGAPYHVKIIHSGHFTIIQKGDS